MMRRALMVGMTSMWAMACARPPVGSTEPPPPPGEAVETESSAEHSTLTGTITDAGITGGKTMAAWNGFEIGEPFLQLTLDSGQDRPEGTAETVYLRLHESASPSPEVGLRVRVVGAWVLPEQGPLPDPSGPMQVPVSLEPEPDPEDPAEESGGWTTIPPEAIFEAERWEPAP